VFVVVGRVLVSAVGGGVAWLLLGVVVDGFAADGDLERVLT
jgi:hypothetical protein